MTYRPAVGFAAGKKNEAYSICYFTKLIAINCGVLVLLEDG